MPLELVPLCDVVVAVDPPVNVGEGPAGTRMIVGVSGIRVEGERLRGTVPAGPGGDWLTIGPGGVATIDARFGLETDDGAIVYAQYHGRMDASVPREERVIHVAPRFETADPRYAWLNLVQAVGRGTFGPEGVTYEWYEVR